jgi:hypothetical protein
MNCPECSLDAVTLVSQWRGVLMQPSICPRCANDKVQKMIRNKELDNPFSGETRA